MAVQFTYVPISTQILGNTSTTITFNNIPQIYTDLVFVYSGVTNATTDILVTFNGDTGANYSRSFMEAGGGGNVGSGRNSNNNAAYLGYVPSSTTAQLTTWNIMNYKNTNAYKSVIHRYTINAISGLADISWQSTAAITSFTLTASASTFNSGATFNLYGIVSA